MENVITIVGNVTADPDYRFTTSGSAVVNFSVAVNGRKKNAQGEYEDTLDGFFRCTAWKDMADNIAASIRKGARVVVVGKLQERKWVQDDGTKRSAIEIQVSEIGPSLRWATADIARTGGKAGATA